MSISMVTFFMYSTIPISQYVLLGSSQDIYSGQPWMNCAGVDIVGGYGSFGSGAVIQHTFTLPFHQRVRIAADILLLDSWDNEILYINVDGTTIQTFSKGNNDVSILCGNPNFADEWFFLDWNGIHTSNNLVLRISSNLDEDATNESWGFTNFRIYYVDDCIYLYSECDYKGSQYQFCQLTPKENSIEFIDQIRSMKIPQGKNIQLQDSNFEDGNLKTFSSDQNCIPPFYFPLRKYNP